ncbi:autotransporter outer membrane beta-barrel domain-containing protein [Methylotenera versatilis]|uniref:autotransporter outer membrane beta-barrel domain-containing protein n=1 Tax=Methylotenera versatilis TaxID=1055487 RepID=UPI0006491F92|nr:autotransporter outer membrane beta-barrel domain-containing protein [Methylotenera versatilis]
MNTPNKFNRNTLFVNVLLALASMTNSHSIYAACVDNGNGTYTCSGVSDNIDTTIIGEVILDTSAGTATLNNTTVDPNLNPPDFGAVIRNTATTVGATSAVNITGNQAAVINNRGIIDLSTFDSNFNFTRVFDPAGWTYDEATRKLFNNGIEVGYAAAITAGANTSSLTINNFVGLNPFLEPNFFQPTSGQITGFGDLTAGIYTNAALLTVNGEFETVRNGVGVVPSYISKVVSFGGGGFTAPLVQDGTQYATNVTAGTTVFNANAGDLYVVDRNILLTEAQALSGLAVAFTQDDVGPRNSIINGTFTNAYLGSGNHVINHPVTANGLILGAINVDQTDSAVTNVSGGISTTLYLVHGDRTFTLNTDSIFNPVTINDVAGAVNTVNVSKAINGSITANGLGNNVLNLNVDSACSTMTPCPSFGSVSGFTTMNVTGTPTQLNGNFSVTGDINLLSGQEGTFINTDGSLGTRNSQLNGVLTASRVIIGSGANWTGTISPASTDSIGSITGNLINQGKLNLGRATLNVDGNANMEAGSALFMTVSNLQQGQLNATGVTTFDPASILIPSAFFDEKIDKGFSFVAATNVSGIPIVQSPGFLQFLPSLVGDNLLLTATIGIPSFLKGQVTQAASNALDAVFNYTGNAVLPVELQTELLRVKGNNLIGTAERLRPEINDGAFRMVQGNTDKVFNILETRMLSNYLPTRPEPANVAANGDVNGIGNNAIQGKAVWMQGFGDRGLQERLKGVDGYTSSAAGFAFGADKSMDDAGNQRLGFAAAFTRGNVSNTGYTANNRNDINSYLVATYGSWAMDDWYVNGMLGIGRNTYETSRNLLQYTAIGQHDSWQLSGRVDAGMPILLDDNLSFVPVVSLDYMRLKESGYTEKGRDSRIATVPGSSPPVQLIQNGLPVFTQADSPINLQINSRSFDSIRGGLGGKVIYSLQEKDWAAELELHGLYRHEFGDVAQDSSARFVFGGTRFISPGLNPDRNSLLLGGSVRLTGDDENDQLTLLTSYDAELRDKYLGQTMTLNVRYDFDQAPRYIKDAKAKLAKNAAKKAPEQKVGASEKDIVAINQAMQAEAEFNQESNTLDANQQAIDSTIKTWATALTNKNLDIYFNSYAADFTAPDGSSRQQWEGKRKAEISKDTSSAINISYLSIKPDGNRALAMFTQTITVDTKQDAVRKIVDLENRNGRWLIVREDSMAIN